MPLPNLPPQAESLHTLANRIQNRYKYRDQGVDWNLVRLIRAYYLACVSFVDYQVGRIVQELTRSGLMDRTLILFSSDHGEYLGDYGCWGKRGMHDASSRVPMLARLPGVFEGGRRCETPVSLVDIAPTLAALSGARVTTHPLDGVDLAEVARGTCVRDTVFSQIALDGPFFSGLCRDTDTSGRSWTPEERRARFSTTMAVTSSWKYFYSAPDDAEFLFDRVGDPRETRNRKGVTFCRTALEQMRERLWRHLFEGGETAGLSQGSWRRFPRMEIDPDPDSGLLIQDLYTPWADMRLSGYSS
jgi:arylsulfatase A-like enzyme